MLIRPRGSRTLTRTPEGAGRCDRVDAQQRRALRSRAALSRARRELEEQFVAGAGQLDLGLDLAARCAALLSRKAPTR